MGTKFYFGTLPCWWQLMQVVCHTGKLRHVPAGIWQQSPRGCFHGCQTWMFMRHKHSKNVPKFQTLSCQEGGLSLRLFVKGKCLCFREELARSSLVTQRPSASQAMWLRSRFIGSCLVTMLLVLQGACMFNLLSHSSAPSVFVCVNDMLASQPYNCLREDFE